MIVIDTNLLIYAHRSATPEHRAAQDAIEAACSMPDGCGIALPSVAEFFSIVTHPAATGGPSQPQAAADFLRALQEAGMMMILPGASFPARLLQAAADLGVTGVRIYDLQIALCAIDGGATQLWTHDAGFVKIPGLAVSDPLVAG
jgi:predicted nucleic acid-binding protein